MTQFDKALSNYVWREDYSGSWALAHQQIRRYKMLAGDYLPNDRTEERFLDWC